MNKLIIDKNKVLSYKGLSTLYAGEIDFEQLRVEMPKTIGRIKTRDYRDSGAKLVIVTSSTEYETALTFTLSDDRTGYISQIIPVDADWCEYTGVIYAYVQFGDAESALGLTNAVAINVMSNVNDDIPAPSDPFARKSYVDDAVEGLASEEYVDDAVSSKANDDEVVHKAGWEEISGIKHFSSGIDIADRGAINLLHTDVTSAIVTQIFKDRINKNGQVYYLPRKSNGNYTFATLSDLPPEGLIFAGTLMAYINDASLQKLTLSEAMQTKLGTSDAYVIIDINNLTSSYDNTYALVGNGFADSNGVQHTTDEVILLSSTSAKQKRVLATPNDVYARQLVYTTESAGSPPGSSPVTTKYPTGMLWLDMSFRFYILTERSLVGSVYTYTWKKLAFLTDIPTFTTQTITLASSNWSNNQQAVNVSGVTSDNDVSIDIAPSSIEDAMETPVYCIAQGDGTLTFKCVSTPSADIVVQIEVRT